MVKKIVMISVLGIISAAAATPPEIPALAETGPEFAAAANPLEAQLNEEQCQALAWARQALIGGCFPNGLEYMTVPYVNPETGVEERRGRFLWDLRELAYVFSLFELDVAAGVKAGLSPRCFASVHHPFLEMTARGYADLERILLCLFNKIGHRIQSSMKDDFFARYRIDAVSRRGVEAVWAELCFACHFYARVAAHFVECGGRYDGSWRCA